LIDVISLAQHLSGSATAILTVCGLLTLLVLLRFISSLPSFVAAPYT